MKLCIKMSPILIRPDEEVVRIRKYMFQGFKKLIFKLGFQ